MCEKEVIVHQSRLEEQREKNSTATESTFQRAQIEVLTQKPLKSRREIKHKLWARREGKKENTKKERKRKKHGVIIKAKHFWSNRVHLSSVFSCQFPLGVRYLGTVDILMMNSLREAVM